MSSNTYFFDSINYEELHNKGVDNRLITLLWYYKTKKKNMAKELFTNKIQFQVFKHLRNKPSRIFISNRYLVLEFTYVSSKGYSYKNYYVIGVNSDNKLFINKMEDFEPNFSDTIDKLVIPIPDKLVMDNLEFNYDLEISEDKSLPYRDHQMDSSRAYRVQGDLVFYVDIYSSDFKLVYLNSIANNISDQIEALINNIVLRRIQNTLSEFGISSEINRNIVRIWCLPSKYRYSLVSEYQLILREIIKNAIDLSDISNNITYDPSNWEADIRIVINEGSGWFGSPYKPFDVVIFFRDRFIDHWAKEVTKNITVEPKELTVNHGRHKITYVGYPSRFNIVHEFPFKDGNGDNVKALFEVNMNDLFMVSSKLKIEHIEHGVMEYNVIYPIRVTLDNTRIDRWFDSRLNYYAIKLLKARFIPQ
jgi:hypothetical protein